MLVGQLRELNDELMRRGNRSVLGQARSAQAITSEKP